jgi:hypothetical protein
MTAAMLTPVMNDYGLGFGTGTGPDARFGHGGANEGFRALLTAFYHRDAGIAIMTNGDRGDALAREILLAVANEYGWPGIEPRVIEIARFPEERRAALAGNYNAPALGIELYLTFTEDGLVRITGGTIPDVTLVPTSETELLDVDDGTVVTIEWDDNQVVELRTRGILILPDR